MTKQSVKIEGLPELRQTLTKLAQIAQPPLSDQALMQGGLVVERGTKENITSQKLIDTGKMRASVAAWVQSVGVVIIATRTHYAATHEFGLSGHRPRPFLRPALDNNIKEITAAIGNFLSEEIKKIAK